MAVKSASNGMVQSDVNLEGKTVLITGANSGIGYETTLDLAKRGAKIIMACRDENKTNEAKTKLLEQVKDAQLVFKKLDLASLQSVRECAKDINETESRLDILINNAGVMLTPNWKTKDGFEMQFGVNHIGHFLLTNLLLDLLKKSAPSRIVSVASSAHNISGIMWDDIMQEENYNSLYAYGQSKTANVLHSLELSRRLEGTGVTCYVLHPGVIKTNLQQHLGDISHLPFFSRMFVKSWGPFIRAFGISPTKGAQTSIYCAVAPELEKVSGKYYSNCSVTAPSSYARNADSAEKLWKVTEELIQQAETKKDEDEQRPSEGAAESKSEQETVSDHVAEQQEVEKKQETEPVVIDEDPNAQGDANREEASKD